MLKKINFLFLFLLSASLAYSQCTSSLGVPILNETFGSGTSTIGPQLAAGITNLQYLNNTTCPNDGQYTIANYTTNCYGAWHTVTDHTGNPNGYFMLINASYAPSDFYVQTINGLCSGTTYQFSSWILNMAAVTGQILPNVTFTIEKTDGTILSSYSSGDIPVSNPIKWQQYGLTFKTPAGVSAVVLRMHNNAPGGGGNDLALDDISFSAVGPPINIGVSGFAGSVVNIACNKGISLYSTVGSCYVNNSYQWQSSPDGVTWTDIAGANSAIYNFSLQNSGTYYYRLGVAENGSIGSVNCRANSNVITINFTGIAAVKNNISPSVCSGSVYILPSGKVISTTGIYTDTVRTKQGCDSLITIANLTVRPNSSSTIIKTICQGDSYLGYTKTGTYPYLLVAANGCDSVRTLNLTVVDNSANLGTDKVVCTGDSLILNPGIFTQYLWQDNSTNPTFKVTQGGKYWVTVTNAGGCVSADTIMVKGINCSLPNITNTFTPNGDGINDTWVIDGLQYFPQCTVNIFSRWGVHLFSSVGYPKAWDGRYNGKELAFGTYYYVIDLHDNKPLISGYVAIVR